MTLRELQPFNIHLQLQLHDVPSRKSATASFFGRNLCKGDIMAPPPAPPATTSTPPAPSLAFITLFTKVSVRIAIGSPPLPISSCVPTVSNPFDRTLLTS